MSAARAANKHEAKSEYLLPNGVDAHMNKYNVELTYVVMEVK